MILRFLKDTRPRFLTLMMTSAGRRECGPTPFGLIPWEIMLAGGRSAGVTGSRLPVVSAQWEEGVFDGFWTLGPHGGWVQILALSDRAGTEQMRQIRGRPLVRNLEGGDTPLDAHQRDVTTESARIQAETQDDWSTTPPCQRGRMRFRRESSSAVPIHALAQGLWVCRRLCRGPVERWRFMAGPAQGVRRRRDNSGGAVSPSPRRDTCWCRARQRRGRHALPG